MILFIRHLDLEATIILAWWPGEEKLGGLLLHSACIVQPGRGNTAQLPARISALDTVYRLLKSFHLIRALTLLIIRRSVIKKIVLHLAAGKGSHWSACTDLLKRDLICLNIFNPYTLYRLSHLLFAPPQLIPTVSVQQKPHFIIVLQPSEARHSIVQNSSRTRSSVLLLSLYHAAMASSSVTWKMSAFVDGIAKYCSSTQQRYNHWRARCVWLEGEHILQVEQS